MDAWDSDFREPTADEVSARRILSLAIAARNTEGEFVSVPVSPCGSCRQVILEQEMRFNQPIRIILVGQNGIFIFNSIKDLLPFAFSEESLGS